MGGNGGKDFCGFGDAFAEDFDFEVAEGGVELGSVVSGRRKSNGSAYAVLTVTDIAQVELKHLSPSARVVMVRWLDCVDVNAAASAL